MLVWLGGAFVILACGSAGWLCKQTLRQRREQLLALVFALQGLEVEIRYAGNPLPLALHQTGRQTGGPVGALFLAAGQALEQSQGQLMADVWLQTLDRFTGRLALQPEDWELLRQFGLGLGVSGVADQMAHLSLTAQQLNKRLTQAETDLAKMGKVWSSLGWGAGLVLVLLWF